MNENENQANQQEGQTETESGMKTILRAIGTVQRDAGTDERRITFCAYPYELDRWGTTIRPSAFMLDNYKKNPISSFAHNNWDELPVARAVEVWVEQVGNPNNRRPGLWCVLEFAKHAFAEDLYQCYRGGFMNAVSVECEVLDYELPGKDFDNQTGPTYTKVELTDISCVPVPGNADALAQRSFAGAEANIIKLSWDRVQDRVSRSGREMSAKNMAAIQGLHDKLAEMEDNCKSIRESLKAFLDDKQQSDKDKVEKTVPQTEENIIRNANSESAEHQPSDTTDANPTREVEVSGKLEEAATTVIVNQASETNPNYIDNWLSKLGW